ncbi:MAG: type II secretion system F family protein [Rhodoglobus sp.]|nr:type II secretion system F family protein [Rhodoglobus sp.]
MTSQLAWAIAAGAGLGMGLWLIASLTPRLGRRRLARRVAPYLQDVSASARDVLAPPSPGPLPVVGLLFHPATAGMGRMLGALLGGSAPAAARLRQSGSPLTVEGFRAQQLLWGLVGLGVGVVVAIAVRGPLSMPLIALAGVAGVALRELVLRRAAARRMARLEEELPVVLEFLTLSLSAGEGVLDAIRRVGNVSVGELSAELAGVVASVSTGLPLAPTLTTLVHELRLPAFTRCVEQMVGALERGTPLAEVLRAQAQDARQDAKRRLIEVAGRKEVAMLFPLVFLILPVTIAFAIFPGIVVLELGR